MGNTLSSIGIIPDGNRRFAKRNLISIDAAYQKGFDKAEEVFDWCLEQPEMKSATIYALSTENLNRSQMELNTLFGMYDKHFRELAKSRKIHDNEVRVKVIGDYARLAPIHGAIDELHMSTCNYDKFTVYIALGYGGRQEILQAVKRAYIEGKIAQLNEESIRNYLYQPNDLDLLIRTGSTPRLSNFLPWQSAYTELYFSNKLWPEFTREDFNAAIEAYNNVKRNFGK